MWKYLAVSFAQQSIINMPRNKLIDYRRKISKQRNFGWERTWVVVHIGVFWATIDNSVFILIWRLEFFYLRLLMKYFNKQRSFTATNIAIAFNDKAEGIYYAKWQMFFSSYISIWSKAFLEYLKETKSFLFSFFHSTWELLFSYRSFNLIKTLLLSTMSFMQQSTTHVTAPYVMTHGSICYTAHVHSHATL